MKTPSFWPNNPLRRLKRLFLSRPLTVKRKIHFSLGLLTALVVIVGLSTLALQHKVTSALLRLTEEHAPAVIALEHAKVSATQMQSETLSHMLLVTSAMQTTDAIIEKELDEYSEAKNELASWLATYTEHAQDHEDLGEQTLAERLQQGMQTYIYACEALLSLDRSTSRVRLERAWQALEDIEDDFVDVINVALDVEVREFNDARALATVQRVQTRLVSLSAILSALIWRCSSPGTSTSPSSDD
jgi:hypothetical protein